MKVIDYKIVSQYSSGGTAATLEVEIRRLIGLGWQPLGPPGTYEGSSGLYQTMVKHEVKREWWEAAPGKGTRSFGPG